MARTPAAEALAPMEPVTGRLASKAELKAHLQEVEAAHNHDSRYTSKVRRKLGDSRSTAVRVSEAHVHESPRHAQTLHACCVAASHAVLATLCSLCSTPQHLLWLRWQCCYPPHPSD